MSGKATTQAATTITTRYLRILPLPVFTLLNRLVTVGITMRTAPWSVFVAEQTGWYPVASVAVQEWPRVFWTTLSSLVDFGAGNITNFVA
jgi:hypothetical protein